MPEITILDDSLINKIAAGEVIERPASVVKELVENALDAGATKINIALEEGGKSYIKVSDNGCGMEERDAKLACERHATSKLKKEEDFFRIASLGFRGEALASIAAVSHLTLTSKREHSLAGTKISIKGGKNKKVEPCGCPKGTTVEVRNLFFNTPARKKYLKSMRVELSHITDIVMRYALGNPHIYFRVFHHGRELLNAPASNNTLTNILHIYGRNVARQLLEVNYATKAICIMGFISKPGLSKSDKNSQTIFVNGRYIKNKIITGALNQAYHTLMMIERYPVAILDLQLEPERIDVNVHPQKSEIRVDHEKELYNAVYEAIKETLLQHDLIPESVPETDTRLMHGHKNPAKMKESRTAYLETSTQAPLSFSGEGRIDLQALPAMKMLGILKKTYILAETKKGLILIDQHAAAERINYEKFMAQKGGVKTQQLLEPMLLELTSSQYILLQENKDTFERIGFHVEEFGHNEFILRRIPAFLQADKELVLDLVDELAEHGRMRGLDKKIEEALIMKACRSSIKAGDELSLFQVRILLAELDKRNIPFNCPHGRPILVKITFKELEKMFKRVV